MKLHVEKGLDAGSSGAAVITDVRMFYDGIDVAKAVMSAVSRGLAAPVGAAVVRHQLLPPIDVFVADVRVGELPRRGLGALTGSRTAGALGRFVLRDLAEHLASSRAHSAEATFEGVPMLIASYVGNLVL